MNRVGEVWAMGDEYFVCLGDDALDETKYLFQTLGSERKVSILKTNIDYVVAVQGESRWWKKLA